ncbi:MAG: hypothetical protein QOD41_3695 [Cryptosporangiaceae bacterium]|nr:hypothetical protein [Cryptosporangiaceae bacterium]
MSVQGTSTAEGTGKSAQDEGRQLAQSAKESSAQVAQTVKEEAANVAGEVKSLARSLAGEARDQVGTRIDQQKSTAVDALRTTGEELRKLTEGQNQSRLTSELTRHAAEQAHTVADYLDNKGPSEILGDVRDFARRKPGVFLLAAGLAGVVVGRIVRGTVAASTGSTNSPQPPSGSTGYTSTTTSFPPPVITEPAYTEPAYGEPAYTEPGYGEPAQPGGATYAAGTAAGTTYTGTVTDEDLRP